jgi:hypothetical protein
MQLICPRVAGVMLTGCETSRTLYVPRVVPPLDSGLAAACPEISDPSQAPASYDDWQVWVQDRVLVAYGLCVARHRAMVEAWSSH